LRNAVQKKNSEQVQINKENHKAIYSVIIWFVVKFNACLSNQETVCIT